MDIHIFDYSDYRSFLLDWINRDSKKTRGQLAALAKLSDIDSALLNKVLKGERELTIEQGLAIADALKLKHEEHRLFYLYVCLARSGTNKLRKYLSQEINLLKKSTKSFSQKLEDKSPLTRDQQEEYMIDTTAQIIRGLLSVPGINNLEALSKRLRLSEEEIKSSLDLLLGLELIKVENGIYTNSPGLTYISGSKLINIAFHRQWRLKNLQRTKFDGEVEMNTTNIIPLKKKAAIDLVRALKKISSEAIENATTTDADGLYILTIDLLRN